MGGLVIAGVTIINPFAGAILGFTAASFVSALTLSGTIFDIFLDGSGEAYDIRKRWLLLKELEDLERCDIRLIDELGHDLTLAD